MVCGLWLPLALADDGAVTGPTTKPAPDCGCSGENCARAGNANKRHATTASREKCFTLKLRLVVDGRGGTRGRMYAGLSWFHAPINAAHASFAANHERAA